MRIKKKAAVLSFLLAAFPALKPSGYVNDFAGLLSPQTRSLIERKSGDLDAKSGAQFALVTLKNLEGKTIEETAADLFEKWGIGGKKKDTGLLLLVAPAEKKVRIETGYGFEGAIPDGLAGEIIRKDMLPYFRKGEMEQGILRGSAVLLDLMAKEMGVSLEDTGGIPPPVSSGGADLLYILLLLLIFGGRWFFFPRLQGGFGRGGGYWRNGGGGFGGFGGFGGGSSGGGGASGSW